MPKVKTLEGYVLNNKPVKDVVFGIYDKDKKLVAEITTDENGIAVSDYLDYNEYYFKELKAPDEYVIDSNFYDFRIENNEEIIEIDFKNYTKTRWGRDLDLKKWEKENNETLPYTGGIDPTSLIASAIVLILIGGLLTRKKIINNK